MSSSKTGSRFMTSVDSHCEQVGLRQIDLSRGQSADEMDQKTVTAGVTATNTFFSAYASLLMRGGVGSAGDRDQLIATAFRPRVSTMPTAGWSTSVTTSSTHSPMRPRRPSITTATASASATSRTLSAMNTSSAVTGDKLRRVRSYSVTAKGVTRFGAESVTRWRQQRGGGGGTSNGHFGSHSTCSLGSSTSAGSTCSSPRHRSWSNGSSSSSFSEGNYSVGASTSGQHNVAVIGSAEVGKTSLITQFIASDAKEDEPQELEVRDKFISILLDGEEAQLQFQDFRFSPDKMHEDVLQATGSDMNVDAFVIVYSVADRRSFNAALRSLASLQATDLLQNKAVILVGNKIDLERCRTVSTAEGREMATSYGCKFIETSDWMNHNVDELLVGIVNQIRLKQHVRQRLGSSSVHHQRKTANRRPSNGNDVVKSSSPSSGSSSPSRHRRSRSAVRDFFRKINFTSRSCDNLHVL